MDLSWTHNVTIWSGLAAWLLAQAIKLTEHAARTGKFDYTYLFNPGGMPSAHTAACCALATSIGIRDGMGSPVFALALLVAFIVMYDAQGVRRAAGQQARILNQIVEQLRTQHRIQHGKLAELLGHTRLEVVAGMFFGIAVALLIHALAGQVGI